MGKSVTLLSFANNEKLVLKQKLEYKNLKKEAIQNGINILEELIREVQETGQEVVLEKYRKKLE